MESDLAQTAVAIARAIQESARDVTRPPSEITASSNEPVLPHSLFKNTRGYIEKIAYQINRTYDQTCYDACAVMIRRLVEVLIIESFEYHKILAKIQNPSGDFFYLQDLIAAATAESTWSLGRNTRNGLKKTQDHWRSVGT
jgi:hypothetical protein